MSWDFSKNKQVTVGSTLVMTNNSEYVSEVQFEKYLGNTVKDPVILCITELSKSDYDNYIK